MPLSETVKNFKPLRAFMEAYCLRRTESCLSLPASRKETISLRFSPQEQTLYDQALKQGRIQIDEIVSNGKAARCTKLFTMLLRLRMICNSGTLLGPSTASNAGPVSQSELGVPGGIIDQCERCIRSNEDSRMLLSHLEVCPGCGRPLQDRSPSPLAASFPRHEVENTIQPMASEYAEHSAQDRHSTKLDAVLKNLITTTTAEDKA